MEKAKTETPRTSVAERFEFVRKYIGDLIFKSGKDEFAKEKQIMSKLNSGKGTYGKFTQEAFAQVLNVSVQTIRNYESGRRSIPSDILLKISQNYGIRLDYLLCKDDYLTESHRIEAKKSSLFKKIGNLAMNPEDTANKIDRLNRITRLAEIGDQLQDIYGMPDGWNELPIENGLRFIMYLDEQIQHAFNTYFKYIAPTHTDSSDEKKDFDDALDGASIIFEECLTSIAQLYPEGTTDEQFLQSLESEDALKKVEDAVKKVFSND